MTFWGVGTAEDDEVIQLVLIELHALVMEDPLQGVCNGMKILRADLRLKRSMRST